MKMKVLLLVFFVMSLTEAVYAQDTIKIGIAAMVSPKETAKYYTEMLNYVGKKIGKKVEIVQHEDYSKMDRLLEKGFVDIAFICSGPYTKDRDKFGVELLVAPQSHGKAFYNAYIIVHKDSNIKDLKGLKGKKFAFTDPESNTGKLVPTYMIAKKVNVTPEKFFSNVMYSQSHDKSIEFVAKKVADGASVDSLIYDYALKNNSAYAESTKIVEKSPLYGIPPVVVNKNMDPQLKAALRDAFLNMHKDQEGREILAAVLIDKFVIPKDSDYNSVREMDRFLASEKK